MQDPRLQSLASILIHYSAKAQEGQQLASGQDALFYRLASDAQLSRPDPFMKLMLETSDAWIRIDAPDNTRRLSAVDPGEGMPAVSCGGSIRSFRRRRWRRKRR